MQEQAALLAAQHCFSAACFGKARAVAAAQKVLEELRNAILVLAAPVPGSPERTSTTARRPWRRCTRRSMHTRAGVGSLDVESSNSQNAPRTLRPEPNPKPQNPKTPKPQNPKTPKPQNPKTPKPQNPKTPKPQNPKTPKPVRQASKPLNLMLNHQSSTRNPRNPESGPPLFEVLESPSASAACSSAWDARLWFKKVSGLVVGMV